MTRPRVLQDTHNRIIRDLRISITDRCNFHCVYCLPETEEAANFYRPNTLGPSKIRPANNNPIYPLKPRSQILTFEEISRVTRVAASLGVNKVRITGGEPLLRRGVENLVSQIASIDSIRDLSLTTNGTGFPALAKGLKEAGLGRVTISLDSLKRDNFKKITGRDGLPEVLGQVSGPHPGKAQRSDHSRPKRPGDRTLGPICRGGECRYAIHRVHAIGHKTNLATRSCRLRQ